MRDNQKVIQSFAKDVQKVFGKALYQVILMGPSTILHLSTN